MRFLLSTLFLFCSVWGLFAQTQIVRGRTLDKETKQPLFGVTIIVVGTDPVLGTTTDENGNFELKDVPIGRQTIEAQSMGYATYSTENLIISVAKEPFLEIELVETSQTTEEVVVKASSAGGVANRPLNELSVVSTRSFSVEETQRYPSSINDPGRMVMAFPGVQSNQDTENDAMIHGNSAMGTLWRLEGIDLINPNHFARPATSGGGLTIFSASLLSNSDFSTGAFAAEYGNAFSGIFDMRFRKGNLQNPEFTFRAGLIGLDFAAEGPFKKGRSSFLFNYRYSTLGILGAMGLFVVAPNATNTFQDFSFNLFFGSKDNKTTVTVFGVGGLSNEQWYIRDSSEWFTNWDYVRNPNYANMGTAGVTVTRLLDEKSYLRVVVGGTVNQILDYQNDATLPDTMRIETNEYITARATAHITYSNKINNRIRIKAGLMQSAWIYDLYYDLYFNPQIGRRTILDNRGITSFTQVYAQASFHPTEKMVINAGVNGQFLSLNNTYGIGPRLSMKYNFTNNTAMTLAYGMHQRALSEGTYLTRIVDTLGNLSYPNLDLKMPNAHHAVLGVEHIFSEIGMRIMSEAYYQHMFNVPVGADTSGIYANYAYFNDRDNYGFIEMSDGGQWRNFGLDLSVEKFFGKNFFILCSGSVFSSMYKTLTNKWFRSRMDSRYVCSFMGGVEFPIKKSAGGTIQAGLKAFLNGGLRYTPVDEAASLVEGYIVEDINRPFDLGFGTYYRIDMRLAYRKDFKNAALTVALDLQNMTNTRNETATAYFRRENSISFRYNSGILPVISFQIDFSVKKRS